MNPYSMLFLQQSYADNYDLFASSLKAGAAGWDYVILTASNRAQADGYNAQIAHRLKNGMLPSKTKYAVIPDPDGERCGSGGATFAVLRYIAQQEGGADFSKLRILCIHSGGDSKRVPQYSACGKIFSPVPRMLPNGTASTLFDEFIIGMSGIPARLSSGMLICSGDVLLLFNPLQLDFYGEGAAALSIKESVFTGKNHGVFLGGSDGCVKRCLQKQSVETLERCGAVDARGNVDIDTGAIVFSGKLVNTLYSLIDTDRKFAGMVNSRVRLSCYADFLYPLAADSTLDDFYREKPEGDFSAELERARETLWNALRGYSMRLIRFSPASFLHLGTTRELLKLVTDDMPGFRFLNWSGVIGSNYHGNAFAVYNSYIHKDARIGKGAYVENSDILDGVTVGEGSVVSGVTLRNVTVPPDTVLHGLKISRNRYVCRMYGVGDNPKDNYRLGQPLTQALWSMPLFKACGSMEEAVRATLAGDTDGELFSLQASFCDADVNAILPWQSRLGDKIIAECVLEAAENRTPLNEVKKQFQNGISRRAADVLTALAEQLDENLPDQFSLKIRVFLYAAELSGRGELAGRCYDTIRGAVLNTSSAAALPQTALRMVRDEVVTRLPVRVNWGGGWSDTPPQCLELGGTVLNAAIALGDELPVEVTLRKLDRNQIVLASTDIGSYKEFSSIGELLDCQDPGDAFSLHKAALIACGVIGPSGKGMTLEEICRRLGGGLYMNTRVINIPKGSGLGTSSILACACVRGLCDFLGIEAEESELYARVLCMEQIMSTGGGWQDQVGGLVKGIKMITTAPGLEQKISVAPVLLPNAALEELNERFALIYTGQRRLARNLLREVVSKYIASDPDVLDVLCKIQQLAALMRFELERGNIDNFAKLLNDHWALSKKLDAGCTNTCIEQIFVAVDELIDGRMICGAGGGGYLQVIMKKGVTVEALEERLREVFADSGVTACKCRFVGAGTLPD